MSFKIHELYLNKTVIFKRKLYSLLLLLMEKKIFGLDFGDLERLEVLGEVEFPAGGGASAKAL